MDKHKIPGTSGFLFFGEALSLLKGKQLFFHKRFIRYGNIVRTQVFNNKYVIIYDQDIFVKLLNDYKDDISSEKGWSFLQPFLGNGILLKDGDQHLKSKQLISKSFKDIGLQKIIKSFSQSAHIFLEKTLEGYADFLLYRELKKYTFLSIFSLIFGEKLDDECTTLENYFYILLTGQTAIFRFNFPFLKYGKAMKAKMKIKDYIVYKINISTDRDSHGSTLLDTLIKNNKYEDLRLSTDELVEEVFQILFGGYETTAITLSWIIYILQLFPNEKKQVETEIENNIKLDNIKLGDLRNLTYFDDFIREALRIFPPVYFIPRGIKNHIYINQYRIDKSFKIIYCPLIDQRNPNFFPDPLSFDPKRFEDKFQVDKLMFFGCGPHKCLGEEMAKLNIKIFLCYFLSNYNFDIDPHYPFEKALEDSTDLLKKFNVLLFAKNSIVEM